MFAYFLHISCILSAYSLHIFAYFLQMYAYFLNSCSCLLHMPASRLRPGFSEPPDPRPCLASGGGQARLPDPRPCLASGGGQSCRRVAGAEAAAASRRRPSRSCRRVAEAEAGPRARSLRLRTPRRLQQPPAVRRPVQHSLGRCCGRA